MDRRAIRVGLHLDRHRAETPHDGALIVDQRLKLGGGLAQGVGRFEAANQHAVDQLARAWLVAGAQRARGGQGADASRVVAPVLLQEAVDVERATLQLGQATEEISVEVGLGDRLTPVDARFAAEGASRVIRQDADSSCRAASIAPSAGRSPTMTMAAGISALAVVEIDSMTRATAAAPQPRLTGA